jgi:APA family basic amino acid/polyamine antiporter
MAGAWRRCVAPSRHALRKGEPGRETLTRPPLAFPRARAGTGRLTASPSHTERPLNRLHRVLSAGQLFALGFGGIVGVGWVIGLGEWLGLAGPVGAIVAFVLGGAITVLVGCCYAELLGLLPACGGEIAYAYDILGGGASFAVGWLLVLANVVTLVFEALGMTWIVATLIPAVGSMPLYTLAGYTIGVGDLALGIGGMLLMAWINVAGLQFAARLQDTLTLAKVALVTIVVAVGLSAMSPARLDPLFGPHPSTWLGVRGVLISVPFWLSGFANVAQVAAEADARVTPRKMGLALIWSIVAAAAFYVLLIVACAGLLPRAELLALELPAAQVFDHRFGSMSLTRIVLIVALLGNLTVWNSTLIATSRVVYTLARAGLMPASLARVHARRGTPAVAIICMSAIASVGVLLGKEAIAPVVNVASTCFAIVGAVVCALVLVLRHRDPAMPRPFRVPGGVTLAWVALLSSIGLIVVSLASPTGVFGGVPLEWLILSVWVLGGAVLWARLRQSQAALSEPQRRALILGAERDRLATILPDVT